MGTHPIFESDFDCLTEKMSQRITAAEMASKVYKEDGGAISGQIPFVAFDEKELAKFNGEIDNGESYLKSVILEARQVPDIVRAEIASKSPQKSIDANLSFKQLSTSSYICKSNFDSNYSIDKSRCPSEEWKIDRLATFEHARQQVANHAGRLRSIRRESKRRPKLPIYPLPEPNDFDSWQMIIFGRDWHFYKNKELFQLMSSYRSLNCVFFILRVVI